MAFTRGTTPVYTITFSDIQLSNLADVYITFEQNKDGSNVELTKHGDDLTWDTTNNRATVKLSQEETLKFKKGTIKIQIRAVDNEATAVATSIFDDTVSEVLYEKVI